MSDHQEQMDRAIKHLHCGFMLVDGDIFKFIKMAALIWHHASSQSVTYRVSGKPAGLRVDLELLVGGNDTEEDPAGRAVRVGVRVPVPGLHLHHRRPCTPHG